MSTPGVPVAAPESRNRLRDNRRLLRFGAWCGPIYVIIFGIGYFPLAGFFPPPVEASDSAQEVARWYADHQDSIRVGCVLMMLGIPFAGIWGIAMASQTYRMERGDRFPFVTIFQIMSVAIFTLTLVIFVVFWGVAAFRPLDADPDTTRTLNDIAFFWLLFDWTPFNFWVASFAVAIFRDVNSPPILPRWAAYLNLWIPAMGIPGGLLIFFKTGPFAFHGAFAYYLPVVAFFIWVVVMTWLMLRAMDRPEPDAVT